MLTIWTVLQGVLAVAAALAVWALLVAIVVNSTEQRAGAHGRHRGGHGTTRHRFMW